MYKSSLNLRAKAKALVSWVRHNFRYVRMLLQALPALAAGSGVLVLGVMAALVPKDELLASYRQAAAKGLDARDYPLAHVACERLTKLEPGRPDFRFGLAITLYAEGNHEQALGLMNGLATPDAPGFGSAHLWQAKRLLLGKEDVDKQRQEDIKKHLAYAIQAIAPGDHDCLEAHLLAGQILQAEGRLTDAHPHLLEAVKLSSEMELALARSFAARRDMRRALEHGNAALKYYHDLAQADAGNSAARLNWAEAALFLGQYPEAVDVLRDGYRAGKGDAFRLGLARAYLRWAQALALDPKSPLSERLVLLDWSIQLDYSNLDSLYALLPLIRVEGVEADRARAVVQDLLAQGKSPALAHLVLGLDAQQRGMKAAAQHHMEEAYKLGKQMPVMVNNLAWTLAHLRPVEYPQFAAPLLMSGAVNNPLAVASAWAWERAQVKALRDYQERDLPRALAMINGLLEKANQLSYLETRGQILARMGRWKEALRDLEAALPSLKRNRELHRTLVVVYDKLGMPEMAAAHRRVLQPARAAAKP
jgi:tetratricopeptide (TPR) repeat protein